MTENIYTALCGDGNWWIVSYGEDGEVYFHAFLGAES